GYVILKNIVENKHKGIFRGKIYPINPYAEEILGLKVYPSILKVSEKVDLAIIVVPAKIVPQIIEECGRKNVKAAIIISAGFSEVGNVKLEKTVFKIAKKYGLRIIGPNCLGIFSPYNGIDTFFLPVYKDLRSGKNILATPRPQKGYLSFISQSGAFGTAALDYMWGEGIGIRYFISYGNRIDVDEADMLEYLGEDEYTRAIMMYVEGIENGRKFMRIAKKVSIKKPIIALKAGRTKAGARAAVSHTAALAGRDEIYEAAFKQCGVIRAYSMKDFFIMAKALVYQPPAKGNRVAIITDGGGAGVMTTDACEINGLEVKKIVGRSRKKLKSLIDNGILPKFAVIDNPIDLTGSASTEMYAETFKIMLADKNIDSIIILALHHVPGIEFLDEFISNLVEVNEKYNVERKPVVCVDIGGSPAANYVRDGFDKHFIPSYSSPEDAVIAVKALVQYGAYLRRRRVFKRYVKSWRPLV
ncbi:MAG TPA: CoA-binding protein, partial [Thermoprotei archaeon]|nr:CoA-binding protein [Thermoprotei archaeon]